METFWIIIYMVISIMIIFLLPFSIFFYETDETRTFVLFFFNNTEIIKKKQIE